MKNISETLSLSFPYSFEPRYKKEEILFFDIETTGLSADISSLYLIGCLYYADGAFHLLQLFADDYNSEKQLLTSFFELMKSYRLLVHYNGTGFDIPYLSKKCTQYGLSYNFHSVESLDIYKEIGFLKSCLKLPDLKQKTIESFLLYNRKDLLSGRDLIMVYSEYMQNKILSKPYEMEYYALLLHNHDDLAGLLFCTAMLAYKDVFAPSFAASSYNFDEKGLCILYTVKNPLPGDFYFKGNLFSLQVTKNQVRLFIPAYKGSAKHFYKNYKDYYYLPREDTAIHKSVADYVDKEFREKAKAKNCYTKREGTFLPQYTEIITPIFQEDYKTTPYYFEWKEELMEQKDLLFAYQKHILEKIPMLMKDSKKG